MRPRALLPVLLALAMLSGCAPAAPPPTPPASLDATPMGLQSQSGSSLAQLLGSGPKPVKLQGGFAAGALTFSYDNELLLVAEQSGLAVYQLSDGALLRRLDGATQSSALGPRRRLSGLLRDGLVEQWGAGAGS